MCSRAEQLSESDHTGNQDFREHDFKPLLQEKHKLLQNSPIGQRGVGGDDSTHVVQFVPDSASSR